MSARRAILALWLGAVGCGEAPRPAVPPARLADTGLYVDFARGEIAPDVLPYSPQYPLWSDGAHKRRWLRLPAGAAIDGSQVDAWQFPIGTRFWKEFAFDRRVETRFMELGADGQWSFATYVWSADERDAALVPEAGMRRVWQDGDYHYDLPARGDCRACHQNGSGPVLGFNALQLSVDRDPLAPHAETPPVGALDLAELRQRGLVRGVVDVAPRIAARSARERAVFGYLNTNCGICHNDRGSLAGLGLTLDWRSGRAVPGPVATGCDKPSRFVPPGGDPDHSVRVRGGDPLGSVLLFRAASRDPLIQMPPLGTRKVDPAAIELLAEWIREDLLLSVQAK